MPTIQQLIRNKRQSLKKKTKSPALKNCPQRRGVSVSYTHLTLPTIYTV